MSEDTTTKPSGEEPAPPPVPPGGGDQARPLWRRCLWTYLKILSQAVGVLCFDLRFYHVERCPERGRCILAPNHVSFFDPWFIGQTAPGAIHFLARENLFRVPGFGWLIRALNALPVARGSQAARHGMETSIQALKEDKRLVLFPEGTRSPDGELQEMKRGIYMIARKSGAPVLPIYVEGTFEVWPRHRMLPRLGPLSVYFGEPLWTEGEKASRAGGKAPKNDGDLRALVEDGWAQDRPTPASGSPSSSVETGSPDGLPASGEAPDVQATEGDGDGPGNRNKKKSSADFLDQLGEAYRALEREARSVREPRSPPEVRREIP